jgi:hypothetical protein
VERLSLSGAQGFCCGGWGWRGHTDRNLWAGEAESELHPRHRRFLGAGGDFSCFLEDLKHQTRRLQTRLFWREFLSRRGEEERQGTMGSRFRAYCVLSFFAAIAAIGDSCTAPPLPLHLVSGCRVLTGRHLPHGQTQCMRYTSGGSFTMSSSTSRRPRFRLRSWAMLASSLCSSSHRCPTLLLLPVFREKNLAPQQRHALSLWRSSSSSPTSLLPRPR